MGIQPPFEESSERERCDRTLRAIAAHETMVERWRHLTVTQSATWEYRAQQAAAYLSGCACVADIGCGRMLLERHLPRGTAYVPVDVVARDERTLVCDLNREALLPLPSVDAVAMLGLLEYLYDVPGFLAQLPAACNTVAVSYCVAEFTPHQDARHGNGWVNAFRGSQIEAMFEAQGWQVAASSQIDAVQVLWHFVRRDPGERTGFVFVGGTGRSGTSTVQEMLAHSAGFVPVFDYETKFITGPCGLVLLYQAYSRPITEAALAQHFGLFAAFVRGAGQVLPYFATSRAVAEFGSEAVEESLAVFWRHLLDGGRPGADRHLAFLQGARAFLATLFHARGPGVIVEKTPDNATGLALLAEIFPDARFVISLRDPGATLASFIGQSWNSGDAAQVARDLLVTYESLLQVFRAGGELARRTYLLDIGRLNANLPRLGGWLANAVGFPVTLPIERLRVIERRIEDYWSDAVRPVVAMDELASAGELASAYAELQGYFEELSPLI